jgi:HK97 family phage major capsid protein
MNKSNELIAFPNSPGPEVKRSLERLHRTCRAKSQGDAEFRLHYLQAQQAWDRWKHETGGDPLLALLAEPWKQIYFSGLIKRAWLASRGNKLSVHLTPAEQEVHKALGEDAGHGANMVSAALVGELYAALHYASAWSQLGVVPVLNQGPTAKFSVLTARPLGQFILTESSSIGDDATSAGVQPSGNLEIVACRLIVSLQLLDDGTLVPAFLKHFRESINARIEFAAWSGDGTADGNHGGMTGITQHADVAVVVAGAGATAVEKLHYTDILNLMAGCDSAALQRVPRFSMHPALLPQLMKVCYPGGASIVDVNLQGIGDTIWTCCGLPLHLTAGAPSTNAANAKVLCFGDHKTVGLGVRKEFVLEGSTHSRFNSLDTDFRAWTRVRVEIRKGTMMSCLKLPAA